MRIDHVNIVVSDLERAAEFYGGALGLRKSFEVTLEGEWIERVTGLPGARACCVFFELPGGGARIELLQYLSPEGHPLPAASLPPTPGLRHFGFQVPDLDAFVDRLRAWGVMPLSEPVSVPFAVASAGRKRLCYFHDPEGVLLEAAEYRSLDPAGSTTTGPPPD